MNSVDVRTAVYDYLATMGGGVRIVSAYDHATGEVPRYEVQPAAETNRQVTLDGDTMHTGQIAVTAVVAAGQGEAGFLPLVRAVQAHFAPATRIDGIVIEALPTPSLPIIDGNEVRVPIIIRFRALLSN